MASLKPTERHALEAVVSRAATDATFRAALLTDPRGAIQQAFGVRIPADVRVRFVERPTDVDALIVLPDMRGTDGELTDSDLESVTGGAQQTSWAESISRH
jgi:hypothetical protein